MPAQTEKKQTLLAKQYISQPKEYNHSQKKLLEASKLSTPYKDNPKNPSAEKFYYVWQQNWWIWIRIFKNILEKPISWTETSLKTYILCI